MPLHILEEQLLSGRPSSSKSRTDSEHKVGGSRSGEVERLWRRPFLAKARKQRSGDVVRLPQKSENAGTEIISGKRRRGNPLEEIHGASGSTISNYQGRIPQRSKPMPIKRLEHHFDKTYEADCPTDCFGRRIGDIVGSSSDEETRMDADSLTAFRSARNLPRNQTGALTSSKKRIVELEKELEHARRLAAQRRDEIQILKNEVAEHQERSRIQSLQLEKQKKSEELLTNAQSHLQCQICLDLLNNPFALSPCGHVLCQACLQSWFKDAPPQDGEEGPEGEAVHPLYRKKFCPCCRCRIVLRPIPVFILKNLISLFPRESAQVEHIDGDGDPWEGIFFEQKSSADLEDEEDDYESAESDNEGYEDPYGTEYQSDGSSADERYMANEEYFSGEEGSNNEEEEANADLEVDSDVEVYTFPKWSRPYYRDEIDPYRFVNVTRTELELLQRGANTGMIDRFQMTISRNAGMVMRTEDATYVLGWNIAKPDDTDEFGEAFLEWLKLDITANPSRWYIVSGRGIPCFWRLQCGSGILGFDDSDEDSDLD